MPAGPVKDKLGKINDSIHCGGILVNPGDLVCGDDDGVCVVPRDMIEDVLKEAEEKQAYENNRDIEIADYMQKKKNGEPLPRLAPKWMDEFM